MYVNNAGHVNAGHMTKMAAMPIYGKLLLKKCLTDFNESWQSSH